MSRSSKSWSVPLEGDRFFRVLASWRAFWVTSLGTFISNGKPFWSCTCFKNMRMASVVLIPSWSKIHSVSSFSSDSTRALTVAAFVDIVWKLMDDWTECGPFVPHWQPELLTRNPDMQSQRWAVPKRHNGPAFVRRADKIKLIDSPSNANKPRNPRGRGESARNTCYRAICILREYCNWHNLNCRWIDIFTNSVFFRPPPLMQTNFAIPGTEAGPHELKVARRNAWYFAFVLL